MSNPHWVCAISINFCFTILPISAFSNSKAFVQARYDAKWTSGVLSLRIAIRNFATCMRPNGNQTKIEIWTAFSRIRCGAWGIFLVL